MARVLVVGAGLAGARTCQELRRAGYAGWLGLVGAEAVPPYDRPPLTKDPHAPVDLRDVMGLDVGALADEVRLGWSASGLSADGAELAVLGGPDRSGGDPQDRADDPQDGLVADVVVLATGAAPVLPADWAAPGVHVLHTAEDADRLWSAVRPGTRLGVVGGGWIGCEAAATAAARGARVTLVEAADRLLVDRIPPEPAARVRQWLVEAGVGVRLGAEVAGLAAADGGLLLVADDVALAVDHALVGLGARPASGWLTGSGLGLDPTGAVPVDPWGRSTLPGVFALGDVAARWSPRAARHLPGGHWTDALRAPDTLAPVIADWADRPAERRTRSAWAAAVASPAPDPVPYVFSQIGDRMLQVLGDVSGAGEVVLREWDAGWAAWSLDDQGRVRGVCAVGRPRAVSATRRAIEADPAGRADLAGLLALA